MENNLDKKKILEEKIADFNPNENGVTCHGVFGLPFNVGESKVVLVPVPWEATTSYKGGASEGPKAILDASQQIDLHDLVNPTAWKEGIAMADIPTDIFYKNKLVKEKVEKYLDKYFEKEIDKGLQDEINAECVELNEYVKETTEKFLKEGKIVGLVGGEHSVSLGYLEALSNKYKDFGVLHIDAHSDLRQAYEGLEYSHASIFYNALEIKNISKLVQVGVRDFCEEEFNFIENNKKKISLFTDYEIKKDLFEGKSLKRIFNDIVSELPENVYISFDIDGLIPNLCPSTGTPVPGGFTLEEVTFLFETIQSKGKKIIGFDLCEVAPGKEGEWDGNVGARVLYKLCLLALKSQKKK